MPTPTQFKSPPWRDTSHRFNTVWKISGTTYYRLASVICFKNQPSLSTGGNFQNKDKHLRRNFIADEGKKLGQIDESGADALIVAYLCNKDSKFRALFDNGIKPHTYCAMNIFQDHWEKCGMPAKEILGLPICDVKKHEKWKPLEKMIKDSDNEPMRYYYLGKKTIHGGDYAMRGVTFVESICAETDGLINLPSDVGDNFMRMHHAKFPEIQKDFQQGILKEASANNMIIRNLFGYPIQFTGMWNDKLFREMYASKPASTVATIINLAITEMQEDIWMDRIPHKDWQFDILQNGHDSILFQFRDDPIVEQEICEYARQHVEREMINPYGEKFNMRSECGTGFNWGPWDANENPRGLKEIKYITK